MPSLSTAAARASTPPSPIPTPPPAAATPSSGIPHLSSLLSTNPERLSFGLWVLGLCGDSGCRKTGNWGCRCRLELFVRRSGARWCLDLDIMGFEKMTFRRPEQATKNSKDTDNIMVQAIVFEVIMLGATFFLASEKLELVENVAERPKSKLPNGPQTCRLLSPFIGSGRDDPQMPIEQDKDQEMQAGNGEDSVEGPVR
ncbi:hypothetical protein GW17_00018909 [Ensete ventricosum]|nr:hypothetical protein GW17_00018909 [Ensete ventricosum]